MTWLIRLVERGLLKVTDNPRTIEFARRVIISFVEPALLMGAAALVVQLGFGYSNTHPIPAQLVIGTIALLFGALHTKRSMTLKIAAGTFAALQTMVFITLFSVSGWGDPFFLAIHLQFLGIFYLGASAIQLTYNLLEHFWKPGIGLYETRPENLEEAFQQKVFRGQMARLAREELPIFLERTLEPVVYKARGRELRATLLAEITIAPIREPFHLSTSFVGWALKGLIATFVGTSLVVGGWYGINTTPHVQRGNDLLQYIMQLTFVCTLKGVIGVFIGIFGITTIRVLWLLTREILLRIALDIRGALHLDPPAAANAGPKTGVTFNDTTRNASEPWLRAALWHEWTHRLRQLRVIESDAIASTVDVIRLHELTGHPRQLANCPEAVAYQSYDAYQQGLRMGQQLSRGPRDASSEEIFGTLDAIEHSHFGAQAHLRRLLYRQSLNEMENYHRSIRWGAFLIGFFGDLPKAISSGPAGGPPFVFIREIAKGNRSKEAFSAMLKAMRETSPTVPPEKTVPSLDMTWLIRAVEWGLRKVTHNPRTIEFARRVIISFVEPALLAGAAALATHSGFTNPALWTVALLFGALHTGRSLGFRMGSSAFALGALQLFVNAPVSGLSVYGGVALFQLGYNLWQYFRPPQLQKQSSSPNTKPLRDFLLAA